MKAKDLAHCGGSGRGKCEGGLYLVTLKNHGFPCVLARSSAFRYVFEGVLIETKVKKRTPFLSNWFVRKPATISHPASHDSSEAMCACNCSLERFSFLKLIVNHAIGDRRATSGRADERSAGERRADERARGRGQLRDLEVECVDFLRTNVAHQERFTLRCESEP